MIFRIKRRADGLESSGGSARQNNINWRKRGRVFSNKAALSLHLRTIESEKAFSATAGGERARTVYVDCDVIAQGDGAPYVLMSVEQYVKELNERTG